MKTSKQTQQREASHRCAQFTLRVLNSTISNVLSFQSLAYNSEFLHVKGEEVSQAAAGLLALHPR